MNPVATEQGIRCLFEGVHAPKQESQQQEKERALAARSSCVTDHCLDAVLIPVRTIRETLGVGLRGAEPRYVNALMAQNDVSKPKQDSLMSTPDP